MILYKVWISLAFWEKYRKIKSLKWKALFGVACENTDLTKKLVFQLMKMYIITLNFPFWKNFLYF